MPRFAPLATLFLFTFGLSARAQNNPSPTIYPNSSFERGGPASVSSPLQSWQPDLTASHRFPILLRANQNFVRYNSLTHTYTGTGLAHLFNPVSEDISFRYSCGITFDRGTPIELRGRWLTPGKKLQIVLQAPSSKRTQTCRLQVLAANTPHP